MNTVTGLTESSRTTLIEQVAALLLDRYVLAETGKALSAHLSMELEKGTFDASTDPHDFARSVTEAMFSYCGDQHLELEYNPKKDDSKTDRSSNLEAHFRRARNSNFGFTCVERLAGNIGYMEIRELPPVDLAGDIVHGAMAFLGQMRSLIFDLRHCEGGSPAMVQLVISYLVEAEPRQISGIQWRKDDRRVEAWTLDDLPGTRMVDQDVYLLVSGVTHSAAEALAFDMQVMKRATLVGEPTRGGAHLTSIVPLGDNWFLRLPEGRAVNPITNSNWERTGVMPDIDVPPRQALMTAHHHALQRLLDQAVDPQDQLFLLWELETLEAQMNPVEVDPGLMASYSGSYGDWNITIGDGGLYAKHHTTHKLTPISDTTFMVSDTLRLRFEKDENGNPLRMHLLERDGTRTHLTFLG